MDSTINPQILNHGGDLLTSLVLRYSYTIYSHIELGVS